MARVSKLEKSIGEIYARLRRQEEAQDGLLALTREIVRGCAVAIKAMHAGEIGSARKEIKRVGKLVKKARGLDRDMEYVAETAYQEYCEARVLLAVIEDEEIPTYADLGIPFEPYLLGLMDAIGEFRRQMLEELKRGRRKEAERYFDAMNAIYEAVLPLRFSNSLLPGFRKKQDVARVQLENARSELLR
jgi:translin